MINEKIIYIDVNEIYQHPDNPRKDLGDLSELTESIKKNGLMQNLTVMPGHRTSTGFDNTGYTLLIGHRRCAAARKAGLEAVPCKVVENVSDKEQMAIMLEENMQRNDLTIYEQGNGFQMMLDLGETEEGIAEKTGFSKSTIRHRLNIAKLDQNLVKQKEQDDSFQMTLKDMYELEKVKDVETRNRILKEATSSRDLVWKSQNAVREAERKENAEKIISLLKDVSVEKIPKELENTYRWNGDYERVNRYCLDDDTPKQIELPKDKGQLYYVEYYGTIEIYCKVIKQKKQKTPEEIEREQIQKNKKEINRRLAAMNSDRKAFIKNIINGKIDAVKNEEKIIKRIWKCIVSIGTSIYMQDLTKFFTGKHEYECTDKEKANAKNIVDNQTTVNQMLIILHNAMSSIGDTCDWQGNYNRSRAELILNGYKILKEYGWSFSREDDLSILDGTSELFAKEKKDD